MILKKIILCVSISIVSLGGKAQSSHDLISVDIKKTGSKISLVKGSEFKITDRKEYDNQPDFINDKQLAFSSADEKGNHDIIIYNFESGKFTNLTKTPNQSEYSPSITDCGLYVSAITVEEDGKQRLWLYPTNFGEPELLYDDILPVGYYDWYDNKAAMFVLGQPNQFVYPYSKSEILTISQNIGRSIQKRPKSSIVAYLDKNDTKEIAGEKAFGIKGFDLEKRTFESYGYTLPGAEDFIWLDKNLLLMGKGNALFVRKVNEDDWEYNGSVQINNYQNISRMAFSDKLKKLVVVMERKF